MADEALIREVLSRVQPLIDQAVTSSVAVALTRVRITRCIGGTVLDANGDTVTVTPDDDSSTNIEATRCSASQVAGVRTLLVFSGEAHGAVYALGVIP